MGQGPHFHQRDNLRFDQLICPWYQSQFEHYLVYILAVKLWLQKRKMTFWHRMAMIFFRLWRKLLKMKFSFSWKLQNQFSLHIHLKTTTHSSVLAWRIPGMREPGGRPSMGSHRVGHNWSDLAVAAAYESYQGIISHKRTLPRVFHRWTQPVL